MEVFYAGDIMGKYMNMGLKKEILKTIKDHYNELRALKIKIKNEDMYIKVRYETYLDFMMGVSLLAIEDIEQDIGGKSKLAL